MPVSQETRQNRKISILTCTTSSFLNSSWVFFFFQRADRPPLWIHQHSSAQLSETAEALFLPPFSSQTVPGGYFSPLFIQSDQPPKLFNNFTYCLCRIVGPPSAQCQMIWYLICQMSWLIATLTKMVMQRVSRPAWAQNLFFRGKWEKK